MSTYYYIGCDRCKEDLFILSSIIPGFVPGAELEHLPNFVSKHQEHVECLRIYNEYDQRSEDYDRYKADPA